MCGMGISGDVCKHNNDKYRIKIIRGKVCIVYIIEHFFREIERKQKGGEDTINLNKSLSMA